MLACLFWSRLEHDLLFVLARNSASNQMSTAVVSTTQVCDAETIVSGNAELLNCVSDDRMCDHSWLVMFLRNTPQSGKSDMRTGYIGAMTRMGMKFRAG